MQHIGCLRVLREVLPKLLGTGDFLLAPQGCLFRLQLAIENFLVGNQAGEGRVATGGVLGVAIGGALELRNRSRVIVGGEQHIGVAVVHVTLIGADGGRVQVFLVPACWRLVVRWLAGFLGEYMVVFGQVEDMPLEQIHILLADIRVTVPVLAVHPIVIDEFFFGRQYQRREAPFLVRLDLQGGKLRRQAGIRVHLNEHVVGFRRIAETFLVQVDVTEGTVNRRLVVPVAVAGKPGFH